MQKFITFMFAAMALNCSGQLNKNILGKWSSNRRDFVSDDKQQSIIRSQKLSYSEKYEFFAGGVGLDLTIEDRPEKFNYYISHDTLYFGRYIAKIDTLTPTKLVFTRLDQILKKPEIRYYFSKTP